MPLFLQFR